MSTFMEKSLENAFEQRVKSEMKQGMSQVQGIGRPYGFGAQKGPEESINWQDYNYPPYVRIIHYSQSEIPNSIADITKFQKIFFELQLFIMSFGLFNSFILMVAASGYPTKLFLYALLNFMWGIKSSWRI